MANSAYATPKKIQMIFMSGQKISMLLNTIDQLNSNKLFSLLSEGPEDNCVPMGDGCFHPQLGYIEKKPTGVKPVQVKPEEPLKVNTFNAIETNMINCDKGNYFDIYCGKEKDKISTGNEVEVWFDISSSMRQVDYNKDPNLCNRRSFMEKIMNGCKDKVRVSVYNTALKEVGDFSTVCMSYGGNDEDKLIKWMKDSQAKVLLLVTDVDEMSHGMRDFLDSNGAKLIGDGVKSFTSSDLVDYAKEFTKECSKN